MNTRRMNRLEELGRVDAEKAYSKKGKRNLKDEKKRIVRELKPNEIVIGSSSTSRELTPFQKKQLPERELKKRMKRKAGFAGGGMAQRGLGRAFMKGGKA